MINTKNIEEAKRMIKLKDGLKIVLAQDDNFNRKILEHGNFNILLSIEIGNRKDKIRQTDSGLNHVLAKIATKNNISMGIDLNELKSLELKKKAERLSKIKQNIRICRKAKTNISIRTTNPDEARDFLISLGASSQQAKKATII